MSTSQSCVAVLTAHYVPAYKGGGPIRTLEALITHTPDRFLPLVVTSDRDLNEHERLPVDSNQWVHRERSEIYYVSTDAMFAYARGLRALRRRRPDILYLNSFFSPRFSIVPLALAKLRWFGRVNILLAPRGEFSTGALGLKSIKKFIFIRLTKFLGLYRGITWHASSALEAEDIRAIHPQAGPIIVKENETLLEACGPPDDDAGQGADQPLRAVFASRIVPMKGLHILLESLKPVSEDIVLDVIGAEEDSDYVAHCRRIREALPNNVKVSFRGPLPHASLLEALATYDVMLFPTLGENFGHIIAEALSVALPVSCSANTSWDSILGDGGGSIVAPNTPEAWTRHISELCLLSNVEVAARRKTALSTFHRWAASRNEISLFDLFEQQLTRPIDAKR